jgi:hypothetical protein
MSSNEQSNKSCPRPTGKKVPVARHKKPCMITKELYIFSKEPAFKRAVKSLMSPAHIRVRRHTKPCIFSKEPCIFLKEPYVFKRAFK